MSDEFLKAISQLSLKSTLVEVTVHPKPGLVTPYSNGSHNDMNYGTFIKSAFAIFPYFKEFAYVGLKYDENILERLREVGILAEKSMFNATGGVNTHKGLIFLIGIISAAVSRLYKHKYEINRFTISREIKNITQGIIERELKNIDGVITNGQRIFKEYGITGIRGEVEGGLKSIIEIGLPTFEKYKDLTLNDALVNTLIALMTEVDDTTVVNRAGIDGLKFVKEHAKKALELGGMESMEGKRYIEKMDMEFKKRRISPGGCADMLSATYMIYNIENIWGRVR